MIDKIFAYISEFAPIVALGGCFWCALYGTIELMLAFGFAAIVLELHDVSYALIDLFISLGEDFENEFGND